MTSGTVVGVQALLNSRIETKQARVAIIGLGYVGLPLAVEFGQSGFKVLGIDINAEKIAQLNRGESYVKDIPDNNLTTLVEDFFFTASSNYDGLAEADIVIICVPTPL